MSRQDSNLHLILPNCIVLPIKLQLFIAIKKFVLALASLKRLEQGLKYNFPLLLKRIKKQGKEKRQEERGKRKKGKRGGGT